MRLKLNYLAIFPFCLGYLSLFSQKDSIRLFELGSSEQFRLKKVDFFVERKNSKEKLYLFEFANDSCTYIAFTKKVPKKYLQNKLVSEFTIDSLDSKALNTKVIIKHRSVLYQVCTEPYGYISPKLSFTNDASIFFNRTKYPFSHLKGDHTIYEFYDSKYGNLVGKKILKSSAIVTEANQDLITIQFRYDTGIGAVLPYYDYHLKKGLLNIRARNTFYLKTRKILH